LKEADQFFISIKGLEKLLKSSIKSIQNIRKYSIYKAKTVFDDFVSSSIKLKKADEGFSSLF